MKKILIRNARVYDGTGNRPFSADVLIEGEKIKQIALTLSLIHI